MITTENSESLAESYLSAGANRSKVELNMKQGDATLEASTRDATSKQDSVSNATGTSNSVAESPRVSKMVKSGLNFVIPKNKVLGNMVPFNKSGTKWEALDAKKEEPKPPPARKTKWGPDTTQDAVVKKGRALALQTRAEQLAAQLESGNLDMSSNEDTHSSSHPRLYEILGHRMNTREGIKREQLDSERREAIGECMKLDSAYKPPSGYKPVSKEAKLYIPVKENPGYDFIGPIFGARGITQRRIEAETGAKITIRGKGAVKEGKMQPTRIGKDSDGDSEELYVHISADTYEKVDAAVALIEPLLTPVDEDKEMTKVKQSSDLEEMNGTLNDSSRACGVCGDIGHWESQCFKEKLQNFNGATFDEEYVNVPEVGMGSETGGTPRVMDELSASNTSQPMLLTTLGAQPIPPRWVPPSSGVYSGLTSTSIVPSVRIHPRDDVRAVGAFPRISGPVTSQDPNISNPFTPRFFQPGGVASVPMRAQPFHGSLVPMVGRMLPSFRGPPAGSPIRLASGLGPPPLPAAVTPMLPSPTNSQAPRQFGPTIDGRNSMNPGLLLGAPVAGNISVSGVPALLATSASPNSTSSCLPGTIPQFQSSMSGPPSAQPMVTAAQSIPLTSLSNFSAVESGQPVPTSVSFPVSASVTVSPVFPPKRPVVPSVRPAVTAIPQQNQQGPTAGGPGQFPPNGIPPVMGSHNGVPPANNSFSRPPPALTGNTIPWRGQSPSNAGTHPIQQVNPSFDRPIPAGGPQPPVPFNSDLVQPSLRGQNSMPVAAPQGGGNLITQLPPQGQIGNAYNNQFVPQSSSYLSPIPVCPTTSSQTRMPSPASATLAGITPVPISIHSAAITQPTVFHPSQEPPRALTHNMQLSHLSNTSQRPEFSSMRPPQPMRPQQRPDFVNPGLQQPGVMVSSSIIGNSSMNRPVMGPVEAVNSVHSSNFMAGTIRNPSPNFTGTMGAGNVPWDPQRSRPVLQQVHRPPAMPVNSNWNLDAQFRQQPAPARPEIQEIDPEYENLMASVGVL
ncbi:hypothetical protein KP509_21G060800 [Ceratopteris richardii]|nr:hypothetical protein KP509_21G060800 [Ceratopteris richardii]